MATNNGNDNPLGGIIKQQRASLSLTLQELAKASGVSASHLGRIERGERFPSAHILQRIARPLQFGEDELFTLAGYLSPQTTQISEGRPLYGNNRLDPYVARVLAQEPVEIQRAVIGILSILKSLSSSINKNNNNTKKEGS
ncbi:MAG: helix-turn-helix transcriptional regulator [Chloroflexi bacterium]|nr:helix-turn-helix transcriptional regulator [Chloroflexota bacterium]